LTTNQSPNVNPNWKLLEKRIDHNRNVSENNPTDSQDLEYFIPGGGIAQKFFKAR
jgi:hypothetical protein